MSIDPALQRATLDGLEQLISSMTDEQRGQLIDAVKPRLARIWLPQPGPQSEAYYHEADETLYGGAAGGGKTDLIIGLATTAHERSLIFRAQSTDLDGLWDRLRTVAGTSVATNNSVKKAMKLVDGRSIEGGHLDLPGSERTWQGRPHDLIAFDEAAQLDEMKVEFVTRWLRSTTAGQRKRVVFATNPPIPEIKQGELVDTGVGDWLLRWFAPWLDDMYPSPAKSGEIRWCFMRREGDRLVTMWVEGPGRYDPQTGEPMPSATQEDVDTGKAAQAKSRTFIRSLLQDNKFLQGTGYAEQLSGTPEPLRSMLLLGDFTVKGEDHPFQVIPTQWVLEAQRRWNEWQVDPDLDRLVQLVLFGDVAQGGADSSVLAQLYTGDYFAELEVKPGHATPDGPTLGAFILANREHGSLVGLDGTGGWAGATHEWLRSHHNINAELVVSSHSTGEWTPDGRFRYGNLRTKMWWEFREALDPKSEYAIALPPGARARAQLTAPHWYYRGKDMFIEGKQEMRKRLGSSTDEADAIIGAWHLRDLGTISGLGEKTVDIVERLNGRGPEHMNAPMPIEDPLKEW